MVDIRATLDAACSAGVIDVSPADRIARRAKALHYPRRRWPALLEASGGGDCADGEVAMLGALAAWLPTGRVQRKRLDALALLERVAALVAEGPPPKRVTFRFQHTDAWEQVQRQIDRRPLDAATGAATHQHDAVLDELRLEPGRYRELTAAARIRALALDIADRDGDEPGDDAVATTVHELRTRAGIDSPAAFERWLAAQSLDADELARVVLEEARVRRVLALADGEIPRQIASRLRLDGDYARHAARARHKQETLARLGLDNPSLSNAGIAEDDLWRWFFAVRAAAGDSGGVAIPADLTVAAREYGFETADALRRAALREWCFVRAAEPR